MDDHKGALSSSLGSFREETDPACGMAGDHHPTGTAVGWPATTAVRELLTDNGLYPRDDDRWPCDRFLGPLVLDSAARAWVDAIARAETQPRWFNDQTPWGRRLTVPAVDDFNATTNLSTSPTWTVTDLVRAATLLEAAQALEMLRGVDHVSLHGDLDRDATIPAVRPSLAVGSYQLRVLGPRIPVSDLVKDCQSGADVAWHLLKAVAYSGSTALRGLDEAIAATLGEAIEEVHLRHEFAIDDLMASLPVPLTKRLRMSLRRLWRRRAGHGGAFPSWAVPPTSARTGPDPTQTGVQASHR